MSDATHGAGFATLAIHAGAQPDLAAYTPYPINDASVSGDAPTDSVNPACALLEERVAALEGGTAAVAIASGAAARMATFHTLLQQGDELVAARRGSDRDDPLGAAFRRHGWQVRWADADKPESFVDALSDRTKAILVESMAAPGGAVTDVETIATIARRARVPLVVDNTLATPYLIRPLEHGADIVLHTSTALLGGHAGARGGLLVDGGTFSFADDDRYPTLSQPSSDGIVIAERYGNFAFAMGARLVVGLHDFGGAPSPLDAGLAAAGIETLALRLQRHCDSALAVARHLARHPKVTWVRYAGLERDAGQAVAARYSPTGAGAMLAFGHGASEIALARLQLFSRKVEAGGSRSVMLAGRSTDGVRLWVGLEDVGDIIADLDRALAR